jgi:hypothetical protein
MSLVEYAQNELQLAGLLDEDSDYNGMLGKAALAIIEVFAAQGHSGASAEMVTQVVYRLMRYEPLTPLTFAPDEWNEVETGKTWQNNRDSKVFSYDGGKTYSRLGD